MKKILSVIAILLLVGFFAKAQTFSEWFRQNKTQIKYLIQQIAAYEVFQGSLTQGYNIADSGLTFIGNMTGNEFALHTTYFNSLKVVSPSVAGYSRIDDIINYESAIVTNFRMVLQTKNMSPAETAYLNNVYRNLSNECTKSLDELIDLVTDDTYTMKDDKRIKRIDVIYADMKDKYAFSQSFTSEAAMLSLNRGTELGDESLLEGLYNIK